MLRKILVALGWVAGVLAAICVALYVATVIVNLHDARPSPAARRMEALHHDRPAARDDDNAFVYLLGFDVAAGESPVEMGRKRLEWLRRAEASNELDFDLDPLKAPTDYRDNRHAVVQAYLDACGPRGPDCSPAFEAASRGFEEWKDSETLLLERYSTLLTLGSWREFISSHAAGPLPAYAPMSDGQELLLLHAWIRATRGDADGARQLLEADLRFWRRTLASSDLLISKMVATAALLRHFKLGAGVIAELPPQQVHAATPAAWRVAITDEERSMQRCLVGEWTSLSGLLRRLDRELAGSLVTDESIAGRALAKLSGPLFQPQDTINLNAEYYTQVSGFLEGVPLSGYEAAANEATRLSKLNSERAFPPRTMYNIPGHIFVGFGPDFGSYARRLGDIEGVRLAALAAVSLREADVAPNNIPEALADSSYRNPYNGRSFSWDASDGAVVFRGLEPGERGEHRIH